MQREFDVVVIGAGPAGQVLAGRLSQRSELWLKFLEVYETDRGTPSIPGAPSPPKPEENT